MKKHNIVERDSRCVMVALSNYNMTIVADTGFGLKTKEAT